MRSEFLPTSDFKCIMDPKDLDSNRYNSNSSKSCVSKVDLEYPKELHELHNDYLLVSDKIEVRNFFLSKYQLKIADFYIIPIGNVKKSNTCEEGRAHLRISFWHLLMNFEKPENQNFEKMKKIPADTIILHRCNKNHNHMRYSF